jgi:hypothetical protein
LRVDLPRPEVERLFSSRVTAETYDANFVAAVGQVRVGLTVSGTIPDRNDDLLNEIEVKPERASSEGRGQGCRLVYCGGTGAVRPLVAVRAVLLVEPLKLG